MEAYLIVDNMNNSSLFIAEDFEELTNKIKEHKNIDSIKEIKKLSYRVYA